MASNGVCRRRKLLCVRGSGRKKEEGRRRKEDRKYIYIKFLRNAKNLRNCGVQKCSNEIEARLVILVKRSLQG